MTTCSRRVAVVLAGAWLLTASAATPQAARKSTPSRRAPAATDEITNDDVVKMVKAGLGDAIVISAVKGPKKPRFDLSPDGLISLKTAGVSDAVIAVMLNPDAAPDTAAVSSPVTPAAPPTPDPNDPLAPHDGGIYIDVGSDSPRLVSIEPTSFKQGKSGGFFTSALTMGIKKMKWKAVVRSPRAAQRTKNASQAFYFYFDKKSSIDGGATNPSEFVLARMKAKDDSRELIVGEAGAFGASSGTREKDTVEFRAEKLAPGVFKVTPAENLGPGEYCFFMATGSSNPSQAGATGHLFDFGVDG
jgi:hypothetical protein